MKRFICFVLLFTLPLMGCGQSSHKANRAAKLVIYELAKNPDSIKFHEVKRFNVGGNKEYVVGTDFNAENPMGGSVRHTWMIYVKFKKGTKFSFGKQEYDSINKENAKQYYKARKGAEKTLKDMSQGKVEYVLDLKKFKKYK